MTTRRRLPNRRPCDTPRLEARLAGRDTPELLIATIGYDPATGEPLEVFAKGKKPDSYIDYEFDDIAVILSVALQHDVPIAAFQKSLAPGPITMTGHLVALLAKAQPPAPPRGGLPITWEHLDDWQG